ncbi:MAG: hypothetical protein KA974_09620 [Saprospiraceae bacterium]|nr:hypothetical protein [Saprospiraceae bacterium]
MKKNRLLILFAVILLCINAVNAQMWTGTDTIYGNEWINLNQQYFKILVGEDGIYRINYEVLNNNGIPLSSVKGAQFQLITTGAEVPIYVSSDQFFTNSDYIEFYGKKNKAGIDVHLYKNGMGDLLNPEYSLFNDTSAYYLSWVPEGTPTQRFTTLNNDLNNLPAPDPDFQFKLLKIYSENYNKKPTGESYPSNYTVGEGYGTNQAATNVFNENLTPISLATNSSAASKLDIRLTTYRSYENHIVALSFNDVLLAQEQRDDHEIVLFSQTVTPNSANNTIKLEGLDSNLDRFAVATVALTYPHLFDFGGSKFFEFNIEAINQKKYLEIQNFNTENTNPVLYDITNKLRIVSNINNNLVQIGLPETDNSQPRALVLCNNNSGFKSVTTLQNTHFNNYQQRNAQYVIITNSALRNDGQGNDYVQQFAAYRNSLMGGSYDTLIVDIQQIYDQFGYGINRHPISIRNFAHYIKKNWNNSLQYILLMGKGIEPRYSRTAQQLQADTMYQIPTFNYPGADNLLFSDNYSAIPIVPIGRIAAYDAHDVKKFLDKLKDLEFTRQQGGQTIEDKNWQKQIIHLSGGGPGEQQLIKTNLAAMENVIENSTMGANVNTFYKFSTDPIQTTVVDEIFNLINEGTAIITFYGHSAVDAFDFSIDNPENYHNKGKYPLLLSFGCYSGNIHTTTKGVGERFFFYEDKGAVAYAATSGLGYVDDLYYFGEEFYNQLGNQNYSKGIGDALRSVIQSKDGSNDESLRILLQQFNFLGDPAMRINYQLGPDYVVKAESVKFQPTNVTIRDSITITFDLVNLGRNITDSMVVEVKQKLPTGTIKLIAFDTILAPANMQTLQYKVSATGNEGFGINYFYVTLDKLNDINELPNPAAEGNNELNNGIGITLYISENAAKPVYPAEFSILNTSPTLKASISDPLVREQKYIIEIDTTNLFNSTSKLSHSITQAGGILKWQAPVNYQDSTVYYWRVSPDSVDVNGYVWSTSSFIYLANAESEGWNQSHYFQYLKDDTTYMKIYGNRRFAFSKVDDTNKIVNNNGGFPEAPRGVEISQNPVGGAFVPYPGQTVAINAVVYDSINYLWRNPIGDFGSVNPVGADWNPFFQYNPLDATNRINLVNLLDSVPENNYIMLYTVQSSSLSDFQPETWAQDSVMNNGLNLFNVMESMGATKIRQLATVGSVPYAIILRKRGTLGVMEEAIAPHPDSSIQVDGKVQVCYDFGYFNSVQVGPAESWKTLKWKYTEALPEDSASVTVFGIKNNGIRDSLFTTAELEYDLQNISHTTYPYLSLRYNAVARTTRVPAQLNHWRVLYDPVPEAAINTQIAYTLDSDTIAQGKPLKLTYGIENISNKSMDSLLIKYSLRDAQNNETQLYKRIQPLPANQGITTDITLETTQLSDLQQFMVEINPNDDQREQHHFNNFLISNVYVQKDKYNPLLDVTFDGVHIMDGDIVAANPNITITLKDENQFLRLADTSLIKLYIKKPDEEIGQRIPYNSETIQFFPAADATNRARIEFKPTFAQDGEYELLVDATDVSGNQSGQVDYKIKFEIITKQSISNILNYPNPFSTRTQFVYTLTGNEPPTFFKIQIMTVTGKIIREITQDELGPMRVGTHKTDYAWDGTDEYGDKLANGVYLYRIVAKKANGEDFEKYDINSADRYFKKGFGKMVILR